MPTVIPWPDNEPLYELRGIGRNLLVSSPQIEKLLGHRYMLIRCKDASNLLVIRDYGTADLCSPNLRAQRLASSDFRGTIRGNAILCKPADLE